MTDIEPCFGNSEKGTDHGSPTGSRKLLLVELKRAWIILLSLLSHVGISASPDMRGKTAAAAVPRRLIQSRRCSTLVYFPATAVATAAVSPAACISISETGAAGEGASPVAGRGRGGQKVGQQGDSGWASSTSNRFHETAALPCTVLLHILWFSPPHCLPA